MAGLGFHTIHGVDRDHSIKLLTSEPSEPYNYRDCFCVALMLSIQRYPCV